MNVNLAGKTAETSIASAAILHIAAAAKNLFWGVSPTAPYLAVDVVYNPIVVKSGHVQAPVEPGLGVMVNEDALLSYARPSLLLLLERAFKIEILIEKRLTKPEIELPISQSP